MRIIQEGALAYLERAEREDKAEALRKQHAAKTLQRGQREKKAAAAKERERKVEALRRERAAKTLQRGRRASTETTEPGRLSAAALEKKAEDLEHLVGRLHLAFHLQ